jgi:hypothetical protein
MDIQFDWIETNYLEFEIWNLESNYDRFLVLEDLLTRMISSAIAATPKMLI